MIVLGANIGRTSRGDPVYDGAAALIRDGVLEGAIAEERVTRKKYVGGFAAAAKALLEARNLSLADVDLAVVSCYGDVPDLSLFGDIGLSLCRRVEMIPSHHLSHALSAFLPSGFEEALVLVADNEGNILGSRRYQEAWKNAMERVSLFHGHEGALRLLEYDMSGENEVSLGELYGTVTHYVGFHSYQHAGKTMALAAFGDASRFRSVPLIERLPEGRLRCPMANAYFDSSAELARHFAQHGHLLSPERLADTTGSIAQDYCDLAAATQEQLELALVHKLRHWCARTGIRKLAFAGGVALNCVCNRRLVDEVPLDAIYIQPNAGDQGQALGNALYGWMTLLGQPTPEGLDTAYLGGAFDCNRIRTAIALEGEELVAHQCGDDVEAVASFLAQGKVVGWFQGRSEWGPRALGNRSILADPRRPEMKDHVNVRVKHREPFRPFAPVVLEEEAKAWFDISFPCPWMTVIAPVRGERAAQIPAVLHVDGTARLQTVGRIGNPKLHALIEAFLRRTGIPVLLNTSFNDNDEPIVETPEDAIRCFKRTRMDILVLGDTVLTKETPP